MDFFELSEKATAKALAGRKIISIRCCNRLMYQRIVFTIMREKKGDILKSLIILVCRECKREIEVETCLERMDSKKIQNYLGVKEPYELERSILLQKVKNPKKTKKIKKEFESKKLDILVEEEEEEEEEEELEEEELEKEELEKEEELEEEDEDDDDIKKKSSLNRNFGGFKDPKKTKNSNNFSSRRILNHPLDLIYESHQQARIIEDPSTVTKEYKDNEHSPCTTEIKIKGIRDSYHKK